MPWEDRWCYDQQLLRQWFALLQLDWHKKELTQTVTDEKSTPLLQRTLTDIKQRLKLTEIEWRFYLQKLQEKSDLNKIAVLLKQRQLLLQAIDHIAELSRPSWAHKGLWQYTTQTDTRICVYRTHPLFTKK